MAPFRELGRNFVVPDALELRLKRLERNLMRRTVYVGDHTCLTHLVDGPKIYVDTRDVGIASHLMLEGRWEHWIASVLMPRVKPGMRVCDIGANFGYYTLLMARAVGQSGHVFSVEVNSRILELLKKSIRVNGFENRVTLLDVAAWDRAESLFLSYNAEFSGGGRVQPSAVKGSEDRHSVQGQRLDTLIEGPVDIIKIDVEGAEQRALAGMERTIAASPNLSIVMEFSADTFDDPIGFLNSFVRRGFRIHVITPLGLELNCSPDKVPATLSNAMVYLLLVRE